MDSINTNLKALRAQNAMTVNNRQLNTAMSQLSTGLRVNSAADDAASLAIGNRMQTRVLSLNQTIRNANDGISMIQTADSAAQSLSESLFRMNELAIQSSNDTNGTTDRTALNTEFIQLQAGMTSIINGDHGDIDLDIEQSIWDMPAVKLWADNLALFEDKG